MDMRRGWGNSYGVVFIYIIFSLADGEFFSFRAIAIFFPRPRTSVFFLASFTIYLVLYSYFRFIPYRCRELS